MLQQKIPCAFMMTAQLIKTLNFLLECMNKREAYLKENYVQDSFPYSSFVSELRHNKRMGEGRKKKAGSDIHFALREEEIIESQAGLDQKGPLKII